MYSEVRKELGLSVEEFANLIGVPAADVEKWERGAAEPDGETARFLADVSMKLRVYKRIRNASGSLGISDKYEEMLDEIRDQIKAHQPEKLVNMNVDEVLIDHISFAVADYFNVHEPEIAGKISKTDLAKHIYEQIKFLF
ncbi:MAG: helix-turn-helix domain-containing protein [Acidobacteria bacterium]|nr:helix-turn-helix domain-containing protein [Acidobacteriota bacterium]